MNERIHYQGINFEWDADKAARNLKKHGISFEEAMRTEFRIVSRICRGTNFYEGVRATIIDKDQKPAWKPARVEDVTTAEVDAIFASLGADELDLSGVAEAAS